MRTRLKGVYPTRRRKKGGKEVVYWYLRSYGALRPLPGDEDAVFSPGTPAFMRSYHDAINGPIKASRSGTLKELTHDYTKSVDYTRLAARTKADYLKHIARIEAKFGNASLDAIEDPKMRRYFLEWRDALAKASPRQADSTMAVLRVVLEWARNRGRIGINHAIRPKKVYKADRSDKLWLPPHIERFREAAPADVLLAFELALGTGQRQADILKLAWSSYDGERIRFRQGKRHRLVDMPVTKALKAVLDAAPRSCATILAGPGNKPWHQITFQHKWRKTTLAAECDGLHFHDLRGTTCTTLSEAGCTPQEIAAMLGWTVQTVNAMLDTYQAMTASLSNNAVAKLEAKRIADKSADSPVDNNGRSAVSV